MSEPIHFHKLVASGNDFIVLDNRKGIVRDPKRFASKVCPWHTGVGADGVLLIEPSKKADFFLRIVNSDGSEAEACGNGYRCVGLFAHELLGFPKRVTFETIAGFIQVDVEKAKAKVLMTEPKDYHPDVSVALNDRTLKMDFIDTGVPHVIIFSEGLGELPVAQLGRAIRHHKRFQPKGTNVNFVEINGSDKLHIRTYERGVEDETLACGTGSVAAALCAALKGFVKSPAQVETKGGEPLTIYFDIIKQKPAHVYLEGGVQFVYEGKLLLKDVEK